MLPSTMHVLMLMHIQLWPLRTNPCALWASYNAPAGLAVRHPGGRLLEREPYTAMPQAREAVEQLAEMSRLGVQPDSMLGTALVDACARSGQMQMAQAAFEELFGALGGLSERMMHYSYPAARTDEDEVDASSGASSRVLSTSKRSMM